MLCFNCRSRGRRQPPHMRGGTRAAREHYAQDLASICGMMIYRTVNSCRLSPMLLLPISG